MPLPLKQSVVDEWVAPIKGTFDIKDICFDLDIASSEGKRKLRVYLARLEKRGVLAYLGGNKFRKIDNELPEISWQTADLNAVLPLRFPFGEHNYCKISPKSIVIVAGTKNSGKTAYLYNFIKLNMDRFGIDLYNSETSPQQMKERFDPLAIPDPAPFKVYERYDNFADVIQPDRISVIDYLDMNSEVYMIGTEIDSIFRKLRSVAVIGLQKPPPTVTFIKGVRKSIERDLAYGGGFTAKRSVLYISIGSNKLKIVHIKTPTRRVNNPDNMVFTFQINQDGIHFDNIQRYYDGDEVA